MYLLTMNLRAHNARANLTATDNEQKEIRKPVD